MIIKKVEISELPKALELVWKVFLEYEAPDYTEEGVNEFKKSIEDKEFIDKLEIYGAYEDEELLGVIATRELKHIALFFVNGKYHKKGIGRQLFNYVSTLNKSGDFTVNSSPYAKTIYEHLGFVSTDVMQEVNGLKFFSYDKEKLKGGIQ